MPNPSPNMRMMPPTMPRRLTIPNVTAERSTDAEKKMNTTEKHTIKGAVTVPVRQIVNGSTVRRVPGESDRPGNEQSQG